MQSRKFCTGISGHTSKINKMVFDFPHVPNQGNLPKVLQCKRLMEQSGDDIGIPLKVAVTYNPVSWGEAG